MVRSEGVGPELASIRLGTVACQSIGDEEHQRCHAAGAEDADFGEQWACTGQVCGELPRKESNADGEQRAETLTDGKTKDWPERVIEVAG